MMKDLFYGRKKVLSVYIYWLIYVIFGIIVRQSIKCHLASVVNGIILVSFVVRSLAWFVYPALHWSASACWDGWASMNSGITFKLSMTDIIAGN